MAVVALNSQEIAILGGYNGKELGEIFIFNTKTEKCQKVACTDDFKFYVDGNQAALVLPGRVRILTGDN